MTLRKSKLEENMPKIDDEILRDNLKLSAFNETLTEIGHYLSLGEEIPGNHHFLTDMETLTMGIPIILVGNRNKENPYILALRSIFENVYYLKTIYECNSPYKHRIEKNRWWTCCDEADYNNWAKLEDILNEFANPKDSRWGYHIGYTSSTYDHISTSFLKLYIIFWNLFLCSLDDDIYNEQLPLVIELAHCFKLDEHIMRDLCRGVEYVLSGEKLSPDCDLQCDTVECAKFFLGKEE